MKLVSKLDSGCQKYVISLQSDAKKYRQKEMKGAKPVNGKVGRPPKAT
jgi:hypothetical protein